MIKENTYFTDNDLSFSKKSNEIIRVSSSKADDSELLNISGLNTITLSEGDSIRFSCDKCSSEESAC